MIIHTHQKSKRRKLNAKQRELQESWNNLLKKYEPTKPVKNVELVSIAKPSIHIRQTRKIESLNGGVDTLPGTKKNANVYTGTNLLGIGTLHKSNAVPIFNKEEAKDQASMRR